MDENMTSKEIRIYHVYLKKIEQVIGARIDPSEENKFSSFQEIDELTKSRTREIYNNFDLLVAEAYLKYMLPKSINRSHIFSFLMDVIVDGMDQDEWMKEELLSSGNSSKST